MHGNQRICWSGGGQRGVRVPAADRLWTGGGAAAAQRAGAALDLAGAVRGSGHRQAGGDRQVGPYH